MLPDHRHTHWIGLPKMLNLGAKMDGRPEHYITEGQVTKLEIQNRRTGKRYLASVACRNAALVFSLLGPA